MMNLKEEIAVVGGGPAGIVAALGAARAGGKVILVEKNPFVGGNATLGLTLHNFYDFAGERCIKGIGGEIVDRLEMIGGTTGPVDVENAHISKVIPINEDLFQILSLQMLKEEGIKLLLQTTFCGLKVEQSAIKSIKLINKWGNYDLEAKVYVDCTGDADVFAASGLRFEKGRSKDRLLQPMGQMFRLGNVDIEKFLSKAGIGVARGVKPGDTAKSVVWFSASLSPWNDVIDEQRLFMGKDRVFWGNSVIKNEYNLNITRVAGFDPTDPEDFGKAEFVGKEQVYQTFNFFKECVDGFEDSFIAKIAPFIGIRESRRIIGSYQLTKGDFLEGRECEDAIARSGYPIDIHDPQGGTLTTFIQVKNHGSFEIPYRCLYTDECKNLLVAGRPISATHEVHGATRVMATCMATGHAAGVAAQLAANHNVSVANVDVQKLQKELEKQGAIL